MVNLPEGRSSYIIDYDILPPTILLYWIYSFMLQGDGGYRKFLISRRGNIIATHQWYDQPGFTRNPEHQHRTLQSAVDWTGISDLNISNLNLWYGALVFQLVFIQPFSESSRELLLQTAMLHCQVWFVMPTQSTVPWLISQTVHPSINSPGNYSSVVVTTCLD